MSHNIIPANLAPAPILSVPCFRCGAPIGRGIEGPDGLLAVLAAGNAVASKAYYMHGDETCGGFIQPGAGQDRAVYAPFRKAVGAAMTKALESAGYVHLFAIPAPVKVGGADYGPLKAASEAAYVKSRQTPVKVVRTVMAPECMFALTSGGTWVDRASLSQVNAAAPPVGAPTPAALLVAVQAGVVVPAPPAPMALPPAPMALPPAPMALPPVYVTLASGALSTVTATDARAMLADGRAVGVFVGGAWATSL